MTLSDASASTGSVQWAALKSFIMRYNWSVERTVSKWVYGLRIFCRYCLSGRVAFSYEFGIIFITPNYVIFMLPKLFYFCPHSSPILSYYYFKLFISTLRILWYICLLLGWITHLCFSVLLLSLVEKNWWIVLMIWCSNINKFASGLDY